MYIEICIVFSISALSILIGIISRGFYNFLRFRVKNDLYLVFLLALLAFPVFLDLMQVIAVVFLPLENWDFLYVFYGLSILISLFGVGILAILLFAYTTRMKTDKTNKWKWWMIAILLCFIILIYYSYSNAGWLILHENSFTFRIVVTRNPVLNGILLAFSEIVFLPFVLKFVQLARRMRTPRWRKRAIEATIFVELLYLGGFFHKGLIFSWETVIINSILQFVITIFAMLIFWPNNQGEAIFMQLNLESIFICEKGGTIRYTNFFREEAKTREQHGKLVWGLVESTTNMVNKIRGIKRVGINHILLEDGTAIVIEQSEKAPLYYIVFTARYSEFTHEQVKILKKFLDDLYAKGIAKGEGKVDLQVLDKTIRDIFFV